MDSDLPGPETKKCFWKNVLASILHSANSSISSCSLTFGKKVLFPNDVDLYLKHNLRNPLQKHWHMGSSLAVVEDAVLSSFFKQYAVSLPVEWL